MVFPILLPQSPSAMLNSKFWMPTSPVKLFIAAAVRLAQFQ